MAEPGADSRSKATRQTARELLKRIEAETQSRSDHQDPQTPVLRTIHHLACTGGTLLSRVVAAMPNAHVLSEVDPLSTLAHDHNFLPTDLVGLLRMGSRPVDQQLLIDVFLGGLRVIAEQSAASGTDLVLRDHSHSQFCQPIDADSRPTLREILLPHYRLHSIVTVRHPLDSYLSLQKKGWVDFEPGDIDSYAARVLQFLKRHDALSVLRYEDFVAQPQVEGRKLVEKLHMRFNPDFASVLTAFQLSGNSGRTGNRISARPRQPVSEQITQKLGSAPAYDTLCNYLGYDPDPQKPPLALKSEDRQKDSNETETELHGLEDK